MRQFGIRVRALRESQGLSQEQLGERCGLHRNYVGGLERGEYNPTLFSMARIARALGVSISDLVSDVKT